MSRRFALSILASVAVGCSESTAPETAVEVQVITSGALADVDPDGYSLHLGASTYSVPANGKLTISDLGKGTYEVKLTGLAANCTSLILSPRLLAVPAYRQVARPRVSVSARCLPDLGTVRVTSRTTGAEPDGDGYLVVLRGTLGIAASLSVKPDALGEGTAPSGEFQVSVEGIADNCRLESEERRTVVVQHAKFTDVAIHVVCVARGLISIRANAPGEFADANGFSYAVMKDRQQLRSGHLTPTGIVTLPGFTAGTYEVSLSEIDIHCDPPPPVVATVRSAELTAVAFEVSCLTPFEIAYVDGESNAASITTITTDGRLKRAVLSEEGAEADPAFSPDGRRIAYARIRGSTSKVNVVDAVNGANRTELASGDGFDHQPAWSPDGREIAFVRDLTASSHIYVMGADGANLRRITSDIAFDTDPDWSPDGRQIVFTRRIGDQVSSVYVMNADGSGATRLTSGNLSDRGPAWSPDGTRITFARRLSAMSHGILVMDSSGQNVRLLANMYIARDPAWSPDGKAIAFSGELECEDYYYYYCYSQIHFVRLDGTLTGALPGVFSEARSPTWRPRP